ncbi:MAG TPA: hypothetical protein VM865_03975 [Acidobacteriaceae bacterium]|nr:hypothetical protein [Acidobacteriaceae bacterium]
MKKAGTGLQLVHVGHRTAVHEVREATTGRTVSVPRIWAVAAPMPREVRTTVARPEPKVELGFYRKYTEALLRRYLRVSMEAGRVPSVMSRDMFRGHVSSYRMHTFEDAVVFCIDTERCLGRLNRQDQQLIQRIALQAYTQAEAAPLVGMSLRSCVQKYGQALDRLTEMFLRAGLLEPLKGCQEDDEEDRAVRR